MSSGHTRRRSSAEEASWGGQLISISDLMASLLFIFILIVLLFAYQLNRAADQKKEATRDLTNSLAVRKQLLQDIHKSLQEHGLIFRWTMSTASSVSTNASCFPPEAPP